MAVFLFSFFSEDLRAPNGSIRKKKKKRFRFSQFALLRALEVASSLVEEEETYLQLR